MVVEQGYTWTRVPGTDIEVRVLANRPVALRYRCLVTDVTTPPTSKT
jgi:hypothetical protein